MAPTSGAHELIGYEVDLGAPDGGARVMLDIAPRHLNRNGSLHGGIIAMMLDAAAGFAASRTGGGAGLVPVVTVSLTTQFLASVGAGQVIATGWRQGGGRSICHAGAELRDPGGRQLACASGVFRYLRNEGAP